MSMPVKIIYFGAFVGFLVCLVALVCKVAWRAIEWLINNASTNSIVIAMLICLVITLALSKFYDE